MNTGFNIYLLFIISWFLHLSARIHALGVFRFDLILIMLLFSTILVSKECKDAARVINLSDTHKILKTLVVYIVLTLPFVQWPGSVLRNGAENFVKAIVFYYFTIYFITTEKRLKKFVTIFVACQSFRIMEPVYLHLTQGYWGSVASMQGWQYMERLSGAPSDTVNPNGLAFIILTVIPFYYYLYKLSYANKITSTILIPLSIYALLLTGSRSGILALLVIVCGILFKSKHKTIVLMLIVIGCIVSYSYIGDNLKDRYASIYNSDTMNAATSEGRIEGVKKNLEVALRRPLFGHGLGTSREANANFGGEDKPSHNLYTEVAEELGFVGLAFFIMLIKSIIINYKSCLKNIRSKSLHDNYIIAIIDSMQVWIVMNIIFSLASYGLSSYEWYLFAGLSVVMNKITFAPYSSDSNLLAVSRA